MGGELMFGCRDRDGKEWLSLRHTNPVPWFMGNPDFYRTQEYLDEILARAKPGQSWPLSVPCDRVEPSEYGVILVDFQTKRVISRQDYCSIGTRHVFMSGPDPDWAQQLIRIRDAGWVRKVTRMKGLGRPLPTVGSDIRSFWSALVGAKDLTHDERAFLVEFCPDGWTIDHKNDRALFNWGEIQSWLEANGWQSPSELSERDQAHVNEFLGS